MSIENDLTRIADALEAIASAQGIVPEPKTEDEPAAAKKRQAATKKKTAKKAATKKKAAKKKASKKVGKKKAEPETTLTLKDDVRPVLKRLRDEVNHAAVKSLLKKYGASTVPQLDEQHFERIVADAYAELGEDVPGDDADDIDDDLQDDLLDDLDDDDDL